MCHISPTWRSHGTNMSESYHIHESESLRHAREQIVSQVWRVTSPTWRSHGSNMSESCHIHESKSLRHANRVTSVKGHITHMKESRHKHERVMSHTRKWVTSSRKSCHKCEGSHHPHEGVMAHVWTSHVTYTNESHHTNEPAENRGWEVNGCALWAWAPQTTKLWSRPPYAAIWMSHVTHICVTIWMSYITRVSPADN